MTPRISVLLPSFNAARYISSAIESIRSQSLNDFELLILDDGSTDNTLEVAREAAHADCRIIIIEGQHRGLSENLNLGLNIARGEFIARMDADDVSLKSRFALQVSFLDSHPEYGAIGAQAIRMDEDDLPIGPWHVPLSHEEIDKTHISGAGVAIIHPAVMMRRDIVMKINGYRPQYDTAEDYDLFLRMSESSRLGNLSDTLLRYRVHEKSVTLSKIELQRRRSRLALIDAWRRRHMVDSLPPMARDVPSIPSREEIFWTWAREAFAARNFRTARKYALRLVRTQPTNVRRWALFGGACLGPVAYAMKHLLPLRIGDYSNYR